MNTKLADVDKQELSLTNSNIGFCKILRCSSHMSLLFTNFLYCFNLVVQEVDHVNVNLLELKEEIKRMLMVVDVNNKPLQKLDLIDAIQRLGISYHFETEIDEILETIHKDRHVSGLIDDNNVDDHLHSISLQFRLLRQHGHKISCGMLISSKNLVF